MYFSPFIMHRGGDGAEQISFHRDALSTFSHTHTHTHTHTYMEKVRHYTRSCPKFSKVEIRVEVSLL